MTRTSSFGLAVVLAILLLASGTRALNNGSSGARLPEGRVHAAAAWLGGSSYVLGGSDGSRYPTGAVRYSPASGVSETGATLPTGRIASAAVSDGTSIYLFGGNDGSHNLDEILRFNPATGNVSRLYTKLPATISGASAIWDGTNAYIFGGRDPNGLLDTIVRFTPSTSAIETLAARLPTPVEHTSAVWDGTNAYIFGGYDGSTSRADIVRFSPADQRTYNASIRLPSGRHCTASVWVNGNAYVIGGDLHGPLTSDIVRVNPSNASVAVMNATLPSARYCASATTDGRYVYVFGGNDGRRTLSDIVTLDVSAMIPSASDHNEPTATILSPMPNAIVKGFVPVRWETSATTGTVTLSISITKPSGESVLSTRSFPNSGQYNLDTSDIADGSYTLTLAVDDGTFVRNVSIPITIQARPVGETPVTPRATPDGGRSTTTSTPSVPLPNTRIGAAVRAHPELYEHAAQYATAARAIAAPLATSIQTLDSVLSIRVTLQSETAFGHSAWEAVVAADPSAPATFDTLSQTRSQLASAENSVTNLATSATALQQSLITYRANPTSPNEEQLRTAFTSSVAAYTAAADELTSAANTIDSANSQLQTVQSNIASHSDTPFVGGYVRDAANRIGGLTSAISGVSNNLRESATSLHTDASVMSDAITNPSHLLPSSGLLAPTAILVASGIAARARRKAPTDP